VNRLYGRGLLGYRDQYLLGGLLMEQRRYLYEELIWEGIGVGELDDHA
jgi:hypothetical protein